MKRTIRAKRENMAAFWFDLAIRAVLAIFFALMTGFYFRSAFIRMHMPQMEDQSLFAQAAEVLSIFAVGFFAFFVAYLYVVRLRPVTKFAGIVPMITAIAGAFLAWGLLLLDQRTDLPPGVRIFSSVLVLIGNGFAIQSLRHLGRSFSILPEGRKLVTSGPYRIVRHPVYVAEAVSTIGAMINFLSPEAIALVTAQLLLQLCRIQYEEKVLRAKFPEYERYSRRTARLIPGIY